MFGLGNFMGAGGLLVLLVVMLAATALRRNAFGPTLVLRAFEIDQSGAGAYVRIRGRADGLVAALLTALGIDTETTLMVTRERFVIRQGSISGVHVHDVPLLRVASTSCGYYQPTWALIAAGVAILGGLLSAWGAYGTQRLTAIVGGLVVAGIFVVVFVLGRKIMLTVETAGGQRLGLTFKPSVIERVGVDVNRAIEAIDLISRLVQASHL